MRILKNFVVILTISSLISCNSQVKEVKELKTEIDSASYALGLDMAIKVKANFEEANKELFLQGYRNGIDSTNLLIKPEDLNAFLGKFFQKLQQEKDEKIKIAQKEKLIKDNEKLIAKNEEKRNEDR